MCYIGYIGEPERRVVIHEVNGYKVVEIYDMLTKPECLEIMKYSEKIGMTPRTVADYDTGNGVTVNDNRKITTIWINNIDHNLANKMSVISQELTGLPTENQELLQVVKYSPNGKFEKHFDALDTTSSEHCDDFNHGSRDRKYTLLLYLNDDYEGGETEFPNIGVKIKPEQGKAILCLNTTQTQDIIQESQHMGCEVKNRNKWICTKWTHHYTWN